ncbi:MAG: hypothetical protein KCHDKBKB_01441 [Elusimicrobia bacterium]|nr:hypothetical protein [Elusimicrobiota bacterium]
MRTILSWIRWKYFVPVAILLGAVIIFFAIFLDPLLARGIETVGGKLNGAKVEVVGLKTKIFKGRLSVARLQVANPDMLMQNLLEAGPLVFQLDIGELFGRRVIINEATLKGLAFNTPRKTSGALPLKMVSKKAAEPPSATDRLMAKYQERFKLNIDGIKGEVKSKIDFDPKDLEIYKSAEALKDKAQNLPDEWEQRVQEVKAEDRLKKIESDLQEIKETPTSGTQALTAIPASLKKLNEVKDQLESLKKEVGTLKAEIQTETKELKAGVGGLSGAKQKDLDDLMSRLSLDFASPDRLVEGLLGSSLLHRLQTLFHYVQLARQHMPSKKEKESIPPKPRSKGMDIEFPTPDALPRFWLMKAALEGVYSGISASGNLSNLTTDPARVGHPFKLDLNGEQGSQKFSLKSVLDHTKEINADSFLLQATGLDVKQLFPALGNGGEDFLAGVGNFEMALNLVGDEGIGGQLELGLSGLKFNETSLLAKVGVLQVNPTDPGDKLKADFMKRVAKSIEAMKEVKIGAYVSGSWKDPHLKINSNLAPALGSVIKESVGHLVKDQREQLEGRLNQILSEKQKEVSEKLAGIDTKPNNTLAGLEEQISKKVSEVTGINLSPAEGGNHPSGGKIPSLDKLFKK